MITCVKKNIGVAGSTLVEVDEYTGLSTDTKPTDATNGDSFIEMDTGSIYFYDASTSAWLEF